MMSEIPTPSMMQEMTIAQRTDFSAFEIKVVGFTDEQKATSLVMGAYVEISNICNLSCSFCPGTARPPHSMSAEEFSHVAAALVGHTKFLYFHLMGEPLLHPELARLLSIAFFQRPH